MSTAAKQWAVLFRARRFNSNNGKPEEITYHLNDMLGTTLATISKSGIRFTNLSSFGLPKASISSAATTEAPAHPKPQITEPTRPTQ